MLQRPSLAPFAFYIAHRVSSRAAKPTRDPGNGRAPSGFTVAWIPALRCAAAGMTGLDDLGHCKRSEAIQRTAAAALHARRRLDCFVAALLAMTGDGATGRSQAIFVAAMSAIFAAR